MCVVRTRSLFAYECGSVALSGAVADIAGLDKAIHLMS